MVKKFVKASILGQKFESHRFTFYKLWVASAWRDWKKVILKNEFTKNVWKFHEISYVRSFLRLSPTSVLYNPTADTDDNAS